MGWRGFEGEGVKWHREQIEKALADPSRSHKVRQILEQSELPIQNRVNFQTTWKFTRQNGYVQTLLWLLKSHRQLKTYNWYRIDLTRDGYIEQFSDLALLVDFLKNGFVSPPEPIPLPSVEAPPGLWDRVKTRLHGMLRKPRG
ncbi:MAG TPA: hypothetical protein VJR29_08195 [bacterium]|nr:hypothetical protein [bacterium]